MFRQKRFQNFIRKFFLVVLLAVQNSFLFRDGSLEVVGNKRFVRIQSIRVVNLLIVDVHFNIGRRVQNVLYKSNKSNWGVFLCFLFLFCFCLFFLFLFLLLYYCEFRNHNPWHVSVSKPSTSVSNQRNSSDPFEIQTLSSFHRVR